MCLSYKGRTAELLGEFQPCRGQLLNDSTLRLVRQWKGHQAAAIQPDLCSRSGFVTAELSDPMQQVTSCRCASFLLGKMKAMKDI